MDRYTMVVALAVLAATACLASASLLVLPRRTWSQLPQHLRALSRTTGLVLGLAAGAVVLSLGQLLGVAGLGQLLVWLLALLGVLVFGFYLPGWDARQHQRRQHRLGLQTLALASYLQQEVRYTSDLDVLTAYTDPPERDRREIQDLIRAALADQRRMGGTVWLHLHQQAEASGCRPLRLVTATLCEVMQDDANQVHGPLERQRQDLLDATLTHWTHQAQRATLLIRLVAALSLVLGLVSFILYVMSNGGQMPLGGL